MTDQEAQGTGAPAAGSARPFPNRTWPWREEDTDPEAKAARLQRCAIGAPGVGQEVERLRADVAALTGAWAAEHPTQEATPSSRWHEAGQPDPHDRRYDCERAQLCMGSATDDELANAVFLYDHRRGFESIGFLTAAKDRIRWLSRALVRATSASDARNAAVWEQAAQWHERQADLIQARIDIPTVHPELRHMVAERDRHREYAAALRAQAPAAPQPWRPIETVPRDGDKVLLWGPYGHSQMVAGWREAEDGNPSGWDTQDGCIYPEAFTHWQPLGPDPLASLPAPGEEREHG